MRARKNQAATIAQQRWVNLKSWPNGESQGSKTLSIVDLFCGCGGLSLGAWEAARLAGRSLDVRLALDSAVKPLEVYRQNFGRDASATIDEPIQDVFDGKLGRAPTATERRWKRRVGRLDLLLAGPPCQGHSDLNNSTRRDDPRNGLYLRAIRAIEVLAPSAVIIENVPAVLLDRKRVVDKAKRQLERNKYHVCDATLPLLKFGVPQTRKRHLLVTTKMQPFDFDLVLDKVRIRTKTAGQFLRGLEDEPNWGDEPYFRPSRMTLKNRKRVSYLFKKGIHDLPDRLRPSCHRDKEHGYVSMYGRMHWDKPAQTITSGFGSMGQGRFIHPTRPRTITPHEAARLQGFPDFFDFSSVSGVTALREMIGNAVPPQLTAVLVAYLLEEGYL